ncbi:hypothetical protein IVB33_08175, partial [Bradyrhizobium sp. 24]|nr:hypothetical protein [Bradyrhizobium sp. 24]
CWPAPPAGARWRPAAALRRFAAGAVIVSIRRKDAHRGDVRSSTAELSAWRPGEVWTPEVLQHRALLNAKALDFKDSISRIRISVDESLKSIP